MYNSNTHILLLIFYSHSVMNKRDAGKGLLWDQAHRFGRKAHAEMRGEKNTGLPAAHQITVKGCCSCGPTGDSTPFRRRSGAESGSWTNPHRETQAELMVYVTGLPGWGPSIRELPSTKRGCRPHHWWASQRPHEGMWAVAARSVSGNTSRCQPCAWPWVPNAASPSFKSITGTMAIYTETRECPPTPTSTPPLQDLKMTWIMADRHW